MGDPMADLLIMLEEARRGGPFDALALGDEDGLLLAGAGAFWLCEELAARAPFLSRPTGPANDVVPNRLDGVDDARVIQVRVHGVGLLLSGRGGQSASGLRAAARSAQRILAGHERGDTKNEAREAIANTGLYSAARP
jgi:hypothetical protein